MATQDYCDQNEPPGGSGRAAAAIGALQCASPSAFRPLPRRACMSILVPASIFNTSILMTLNARAHWRAPCPALLYGEAAVARDARGEWCHRPRPSWR